MYENKYVIIYMNETTFVIIESLVRMDTLFCVKYYSKRSADSRKGPLCLETKFLFIAHSFKATDLKSGFNHCTTVAEILVPFPLPRFGCGNCECCTQLKISRFILQFGAPTLQVRRQLHFQISTSLVEGLGYI